VCVEHVWQLGGESPLHNLLEQAFMVESWGEAPLIANKGIEVPVRLEILWDFS
jgi:hypothetical protein